MVEIYIVNCLIKLQKLTGTQFIDLLARKYPSTESRLLFSDDTIPTWINPPDTPYKWDFLLMLPPKLPESIRQSRHSLPSAGLTPPQPLTWCCCNSRSPPRVIVVITTMSGQQQTAWLHYTHYTGTRLGTPQPLSPLSNKLDLMARHCQPASVFGWSDQWSKKVVVG